MNRSKQAAVLTHLARALRDAGSWCGETHMQKAVYIGQTAFGLPTEFDFILYKHGPFSFDLRDELTALRATNLLALEPQSPPYGPKLAPTVHAGTLEDAFAKSLGAHKNAFADTAAAVGDRGVVELEALATALMLADEHADEDEDALTRRLRAIKPHIDERRARESIEEAGRLVNASR